MIKEIKIPEIGEKVESGQVIEVLVKEGDSVQVEQGIIELETDKAVVEIPAVDSGKITEILVSSGDEVKIGQVIAKLETDAEAAEEEAEEEEPEPEEEKETAEEAEPEEEDEEEPEPKEQEKPKKKEPAKGKKKEPEKAKRPAKKEEEEKRPVREAAEVPASPSVRRLARELGVDITKVAANKAGARITADDVKNYVQHFVGEEGPSDVAARPSEDLPDFSQWGEIERVALSQVRKLIASGTSTSWSTVPHVTQFDEADITHTNEFIDDYRSQVEKEDGKLTITAVLLKVISRSLKQFPRFNASIDVHNGQLILKKYCHIGMAVDTDRGLLVPVIRDVDKKSILQLAVELTELAQRTRNKKVQPDELDGGSFTISNQGSIGGTNFTPIVLWPQVAILGVSRSSIRPVFIDGEFRPREILPLSLSYDHRVVDGADAARFLRWVVEALEHPLLMHLDIEE